MNTQVAVSVSGSEVRVIKPSLSALLKSKGGASFFLWDAPVIDERAAALAATGRVADYIESQAITNRALATLRARAEKGRAILARFSNVGSPAFADTLANSFALAERTSALGANLGPAGMIGGACVGLLTGLVSGVVPFERNAAESQWRSLMGQLSPVDRLSMIPYIRSIAQANLRAQTAEGNPVSFDPQWQWADDPWAGHSPWGGPVGRTVALVEIMLEFPLVDSSIAGDNLANEQLLTAAILCFVSGAHNPEKRLFQMRALFPRLPKILGPFAAYLPPFYEKTIGQIRSEYAAQVSSKGTPSAFNLPVTTRFERALIESESRT